MNIETSAAGSVTFLNQDNEVLYPCRCGTNHRGLYAAEEYAHHNCFHDQPLVFIFGPADTEKQSDWQLVCGQCGETFDIGESK